MDELNQVHEVYEAPKRKGRGPGKRPALVSTSVRLSKRTMDFFNTYHLANKQAAMRRVLDAYVDSQLQTDSKELNYGTQENEQEREGSQLPPFQP